MQPTSELTTERSERRVAADPGPHAQLTRRRRTSGSDATREGSVMRRKRRYEVIAERSGRGWALSAVGVRGALSKARRLVDAELKIREAIASVLQVSQESFDVEVDVRGRLSRPRRALTRTRARAIE